MATEQEKLQVLVDAGIAGDDDIKRLAILSNPAAAEATETTASTPAPVAEAEPVAAGEAIDFEDNVDEDAFKRGGSQFNMPSGEGFYKSKLVEIMKPTFTEKEQKWFIFVTDDPQLKVQGRGVISAEFTKGAFKLKDILDGLNIPYTQTGGTVKYKIALPYACYADWSRDSKGLGEVRISGLRTLEAGAAVEKAI